MQMGRVGLSRRGILFAIAGAIAAVGILPAIASAATYCVNNPGGTCDGGSYTAVQLQMALNDADNNGIDDTVKVATGSYTGPFMLQAGADNDVIDGAGQGATNLTFTAAFNSAQEVLELTGGKVTDLTITIPDDGDVGPGQDIGLQLVSGASAERVDVLSPTGDNVIGVQLSGSAFSDGNITLKDPAGAANIGVDAGGVSTVSDVAITAGMGFRHNLGTLTVDRAAVKSSYRGAEIGNGSLNVSNSIIDLGTADFATGVAAGNPNPTASETITVNLEGVTIFGGGAGSGGVVAVADDATVGITDTITATIANTVVEGPAFTLAFYADNGDTATVTTSYSDYDATPGVLDIKPDLNNAPPSGTATHTPTNQTNVAIPGLDATGHLLPTSQLIDIGDPADPLAPVDIDGNARELFGLATCPAGTPRRDIGGDEFVPAACPGPGTGGGAGAPPTPAAPVVIKCRKGFKLKKIRGKKRCVRKKKKR